MTGQTILTVTGTLVGDPEIRFTDQGTPVARFKVASTPRIYDHSTGRWTDGEPLLLTCTVWRHVAEHACECLQHGMHVIVQGRLRQHTYTDRENVRRTVFDLDADDVGLSLRHRIAHTDATLPIPAPPSLPAPAQTAPAAPPGTTEHQPRPRPQQHNGWARIR
ncbi:MULTISPECIES: single-stranded DNA-binding protein [Streptomyces]